MEAGSDRGRSSAASALARLVDSGATSTAGGTDVLDSEVRSDPGLDPADEFLGIGRTRADE